MTNACNRDCMCFETKIKTVCYCLVAEWIVWWQIVSLQERLSRLEQDREHWKLETQLMQMKYEKEAQVC